MMSVQPTTTRENADFVRFVTHKFDEMKELFIKKNEQYGTGDPLANFRTAALMHSGEASYEAMYEEAKAFMRKHIAHIENNGIGGANVAESLGDVMVYCNIMKYMVNEWEKNREDKA
jgi:hydroxymethylpyrimidine/phosphomethylpyrimidine kinase